MLTLGLFADWGWDSCWPARGDPQTVDVQTSESSSLHQPAGADLVLELLTPAEVVALRAAPNGLAVAMVATMVAIPVLAISLKATHILNALSCKESR